MNNLIVYLNAERVGSLKQDDSGLLQFSYDQTWLEKPDAMPLSRSLPLQSEVFSGKRTRPFFAGILPEEGPREKIAEILGISSTNDFALLKPAIRPDSTRRTFARHWDFRRSESTRRKAARRLATAFFCFGTGQLRLFLIFPPSSTA